MDPRPCGMCNLDEFLCASGRDPLGTRLCGPRMLIPQQMPLLVEHRLQIALLAIVENPAPIDRLVARSPGLGSELADQGDYGRLVE